MFNYQEEHKKLCDLMHETYIKKNSDYGNSFSDLYDEYGSIISEIHIREKFNRFKQLRTNESQVGESIEDTLMDMANYCLLTLLEMKKLNSYIDEEVIEENIELEEVQEEVQDLAKDTTEEIVVKSTRKDIKSEFKRENHDTEYLFDEATKEEIEKIKSAKGCLK